MERRQDKTLHIGSAFRGNSTATRVLRDCVQQLRHIDISRADTVAVFEKVRRALLEAADQCGETAQALRVVICVLCDLRAQGWCFRVRRDGQVKGTYAALDRAAPEIEKERTRVAHLLERNEQLCEPATRRFIVEMEQRRLGPGGWTSVFSLMRDGRELARRLRDVRMIAPGPDRVSALKQVIAPYIQIVDTGQKCELTGLNQGGIWRYFRHTWVNSYKSIPGRNMWILVRDRAARNHPVIGIAALGSSVVQISPRDTWIGWQYQGFLNDLKERPTLRDARWLHKSLQGLLANLYIDDFVAEGILTRQDIARPQTGTLDTLFKEAETAARQHRLYPNKQLYKTPASDLGREEWRERATSNLFRSKRARALAQLLAIRRAFIEKDFGRATVSGLAALLRTGDGRKAVATVLRQVKAEHVGIDMQDIIVCGAVAPYNPLLGGKLVAMLLTSPEVIGAYARRYRNTPSVIASAMAGKAVCRKPRLVLLGTTSLYGAGSSQYNRITIPAKTVGGTDGEAITYERLGRTIGYGSFHFSTSTLREMGILLARRAGGRRVNSIFGEGVNPRLRKIRDALQLVGFPCDTLLNHGNPRIVYGIALATNFRQVLLGKAKTAHYVFPTAHPENVTDRIVDYWMTRWLSKRIESDDVLDSVAGNTLAYPIDHGARVQLPQIEDEVALFVPE